MVKKTLNQELMRNIHDRFLTSAQEILCHGDLARTAAENAVQRFRDEYIRHNERPPKKCSLIQWAQDVLDLEIDVCFHRMMDQIRNQDKKTEKTFLTMIKEKFSRNIQNKISIDSLHWDKCEIEDVVSEAVIIVSTRCLKVKFKGLFIQWAQTVLNNKYRERRRQKIRKMVRERQIEDEEYEKRYDRRLPDVIGKRQGTEVDPKEAEATRQDFADEDPVNPFDGDAYYFGPDVLIEGSDLKEQLLKLIKRIKRKACAKVFRVLFSEGDRKFMAEQFPNHTKQQIDLLVSQCRKQLKLQAERMGVL